MFKKENIIFKASKCKFAQTKIEYLGQIISFNTVMPKNSNTKAIELLLIPDSRKKLQGFLDKINFYLRFIY